MMCEDFIKISAEQKRLLEQQHKAMTEYKLILIKRAHRINWEAGRDKVIQDITDRIEKEKEKPTTTNPEILGCEDCRHALYKPEDKGKPSCGNPDADGKTCWESKTKKESCKIGLVEKCKIKEICRCSAFSSSNTVCLSIKDIPGLCKEEIKDSFIHK